MRKFVNKQGQIYFATKEFEISLMEREGYTEVIEKSTKKKTEK